MTPEIPYSLALARGAMCRCPNCGKGRLFRKFLKVADHCDACGEAYFHHRADDLPAYLMILVLGHILVPLTITVELVFHPAYWVHLALWLPIGLGLSIGLLQPVKGMVVAFQWRAGLHGFHRSNP